MRTDSYQTYSQFLLALSLCAVVAFNGMTIVNAQTGVIAEGDPPLTGSMMNRIVNLFEWSLQVEFSQQDRGALQQAVASYWRAGDAKSIQSVREILAFEQKMQTWSDEQKQQAQPQLQQKLLENFEQNQSDGMSNLLLAIYRRGQSSGSPGYTNGDGATSLAELAGKWQVLHGNSIVGVDINSGRIGDGNSMIAEFDVRPDGRVIYSFALQQSNYGCTTRIKTSKTGRATISGSRITFAYDGGTTASEDNCNAKYNYSKKLAPEKETFDFNLKRGGNGKPQFCFANDKLKDCAIKIK